MESLKYSIFLLLLLSMKAQAGSIIKCQAADGSITFADTRCPAGQSQLSKKAQQQRRLSNKTSLKNLQKGSEYPPAKFNGTMSKIVFQSNFVQALQSLQAIKMNMVQFYLYRGQWPQKLEDMGLQKERMTSSLIRETSLADQGRLQIKLSDNMGEKREIWLYPNSAMGGTQIEWQCYTNYPAELLIAPTGQQLCQSRFF